MPEIIIGGVCRVLARDRKNRKVTLHIAPESQDGLSLVFKLTDTNGREYVVSSEQVVGILHVFEAFAEHPDVDGRLPSSDKRSR